MSCSAQIAHGGQLNDEPANVSALHRLPVKVHIEWVGSTEKDLGRWVEAR